MKAKRSNFSARMMLVVMGVVVFFMILNIVYINVTGVHFISGQNMKKFADERGGGQKIDTLYARRGSIYSRDGQEIASDVKKYKLYAVLSTTRVNVDKTPAHVVDKEDTAKKLAQVLDASEKDILAKLNKKQYQVEFGSYGTNLTSIEKDKIEALDLPGLEFEEMMSRNYRYSDFASYEVGYAYFQDEHDYTMVGQMGIEKSFNDYLTGTNGEKVHLVDNNNYTLPNGVLSETAPIAGNDVYLTIDSDVQLELDRQLSNLTDVMKADKATCAVMEAKTGRILAISNQPSFDPNERKLENYTDLFFTEALEPGSVFKTFVYANALSDNKLNLQETYKSGIYDYKGTKIRDHNQGRGWGTISYERGYFYSSNTAICNILMNKVDKESLLEDYNDLGFFKESEIDGLSSAAGFAGYSREGERTLEYLNTGFGQGSTFTGLQLMRAYSAFANNGKIVEPYLVEKVVDSQNDEVVYEGKTQLSKQIYSEEAVQQIRDLMSGVINEKGSTGYAYHMDDVNLIGKTGTGQVAKDGRYLSNYLTHSFVGMAPYDDPEIVIVMWYQNTILGSAQSAELVKAVTRVALDKIQEQPTEIAESTTFVLDSYMNQSVDYVKQTLSEHNLTPIVIGNGKTVVDQYPKSQVEVSNKSRVFIKTNDDSITMPSMKGWSRKESEAFASMTGLDLIYEGIGSVETQSLKKGTKIKKGMKLKVTAK